MAGNAQGEMRFPRFGEDSRGINLVGRNVDTPFQRAFAKGKIKISYPIAARSKLVSDGLYIGLNKQYRRLVIADSGSLQAKLGGVHAHTTVSEQITASEQKV
jgi:hypothetical protein